MLTPGAKGAAPDRRVLVALPGEKNRAQWERLLGEEGFREVAFAASGGEARRLLLAGAWDAVVVSAPLPDEFGHQLAMDAAEEGPGVLLAVKSDQWEGVYARVAPYGVLTLGRPFSRGMFSQAVGLLLASQAKAERYRAENEKLRQKLEELRVVSRAKCLLVEYLHLTRKAPTSTWSARPWRNARPAGPWRRKSCGNTAEAL